ncbi:MAG: diguanylate cyclase [Acidimicrobiales bacterium]
MTDSEVSLPPVAVMGRDDPDEEPRGYHLELHPDDAEGLDALIAHVDVEDAHAILRWSDGDRWRLVEHRVDRRLADGSTLLTRADVTLREQLRERAGRDDAYWRAVLRNGHESIAVVEPEGFTITHASDHLASLLGVASDELRGSRALWHVDPRDLPEVRRLFEKAAGEDGPHFTELRLRRPQGEPVWMEAVLSDATADPAVRAYVLNLREIGDRKAAEEQLRSSEHLFRMLVHHLADGAFVVDHTGHIAFVSERAAEAVGRTVEGLRGAPVPLVSTPEGLELVSHDPVGPPVPLSQLPAEVRGPRGRWFHLTGHDLRDDPIVSGWMVVLRDITDGRVRVERLRREASQDPLTGLLNRRGLESRVADHLERGRSVGLGYLDLDGFKAVNDVHGHAAGDALLCSVAERLRRCVRPGDEVARFGGDEFVVAFVDLPSDGELVEMTNRVVRSVAGTYATAHGPVDIGVSAGWSVAGAGIEVADALARADYRMYEQKRRQQS